ncbi:efflux RND transporter periplasmic adaptor subunit [Helicobacter sp. MIT 05-5293]|nr:efflux RND transporter periplasmic adaptor subunit [Helicobacter sp. MIT 05-5293]TLD82305.1 efflux RND transporter periplasmic adaptor subunit [Helicobacter sp. MIT 05-5293]
MFRVVLVCLMFVSFAKAEDVYAIFNAEAIQDADLKLAVSGIVNEIFVDVGSEVHKGDKLLTLYSQDLEAQVIALEHQYTFAKKQYERYNRSGGAVDRNTLDRYRSEFKKLEADYNYHRVMLNKTILRAPFDGVVASKDVDLGEGVSANSTTLFRVISKEVKLVLEFDFKYVSKIKVGDTFDFSIDGRKETMSAKISKIYPTASTTNRKVKAEALVSGVIPGTFGDGYIRIK